MKTKKPNRPSIFSKEYVNPYGTYEGPAGNPDQWRGAFQDRFTNAQIEEILQDDSPWSILGLEPGATTKQIKKAFHTLAMKYHPDRNPGIKDAEMFRKVNAAYQKLTEK